MIGIRKNGEKFPIWVSSVIFSEEGEDQKTFTIIHDISELKKREQELKDAELKMRMVLDNTEELFIILDKDLRVINFNKATEEKSKRLLGVPFEIGRSIFDSADPKRIPFLKDLYAEVLSGAVRKSIVEIPATPQNSKVIVDIRYSPLFDNDNVIGVIINVHDITEAKEKEAALLQANERFHYAN